MREVEEKPRPVELRYIAEVSCAGGKETTGALIADDSYSLTELRE